MDTCVFRFVVGWYNIAFAKGCGFWWIMLVVVGAGVLGGFGVLMFGFRGGFVVWFTGILLLVWYAAYWWSFRVWWLWWVWGVFCGFALAV